MTFLTSFSISTKYKKSFQVPHAELNPSSLRICTRSVTLSIYRRGVIILNIQILYRYLQRFRGFFSISTTVWNILITREERCYLSRLSRLSEDFIPVSRCQAQPTSLLRLYHGSVKAPVKTYSGCFSRHFSAGGSESEVSLASRAVRIAA